MASVGTRIAGLAHTRYRRLATLKGQLLGFEHQPLGGPPRQRSKRQSVTGSRRRSSAHEVGWGKSRVIAGDQAPFEDAGKKAHDR